MLKWMAMRPEVETVVYNRYGLVVTRSVRHRCPRCHNQLNAGPKYQPNYCDQCGQKVTFAGIVFKEEERMMYIENEVKQDDQKREDVEGWWMKI